MKQTENNTIYQCYPFKSPKNKDYLIHESIVYSKWMSSALFICFCFKQHACRPLATMNSV